MLLLLLHLVAVKRGREIEGKREREEKRCEYLQAVNKQLNELHGHKPNASARAS